MTSKRSDSHRKAETSSIDTPLTPPTIPPPIPANSHDSSELLSPWWSAEPSPDQSPVKKEERKSTSRTLIRFSRIERAVGIERCLFVVRPRQLSEHGENQTDASDCRMVCLFRENEEKRLEKNNATSWNPMIGYWLVVASNAAACKEHLQESTPLNKNRPNYYTVELGERFNKSGEDIKNTIRKTFTPIQELSRRYIGSWKDGSQVTFFSRFWESAQRGDAIRLLHESAKRLLESATSKNEGDKDK